MGSPRDCASAPSMQLRRWLVRLRFFLMPFSHRISLFSSFATFTHTHNRRHPLLPALDSITEHKYHIVEEYTAQWLPLGSERLRGPRKAAPPVSSPVVFNLDFDDIPLSRARKHKSTALSTRNCSRIQPNQHSTVVCDSSAFNQV